MEMSRKSSSSEYIVTHKVNVGSICLPAILLACFKVEPRNRYARDQGHPCLYRQKYSKMSHSSTSSTAPCRFGIRSVSNTVTFADFRSHPCCSPYRAPRLPHLVRGWLTKTKSSISIEQNGNHFQCDSAFGRGCLIVTRKEIG